MSTTQQQQPYLSESMSGGKQSFAKVDRKSQGSLNGMNQPLLQGTNSMSKQPSSGKQSRVVTQTQEYQFEEVPESAHPPPFYTSSELYGKKVSQEDEDMENMMSQQFVQKLQLSSEGHNENSNINHTQSIKEGDIPGLDDKTTGTMIEREQRDPASSITSVDDVNNNRNHSQISRSTVGGGANNNLRESNTSRPRNLSLVQPGTIIETDKPFHEEIFRCISFNDVIALKNVLSIHADTINLITMRDARQFTVLSFSCYKNNEECFMILYDFALEKNLSSLKTFDEKNKLLSSWANAPTDEEFTALHFATYHGNYNLIKFLIETAKADIHKKNKFGSTVLHIAAQGDQALPIYYFYNLGMDINIKDNRQSTPLHWACYSKSEIALNYLLAMNPDLNSHDQKGFTPLHLAVKSVEALKSTRPVRALLLKGANRESKDLDGRTPALVIGERVPDNTRLEMETMLAKPSYWECLMIKTPLVPLKPNHKTQFVLGSILTVIVLLFWTIIFPHQVNLYFSIPSAIFTLMIVLSYSYASGRDAGKLKTEDGLEFLELLQRFSPTDLCPDCKVIRTPRSRHCAICNVCVERFDHHCPWINNCVGVNNHNAFLFFLGSTFLFIVFSVVIVLESLIRGFMSDEGQYHPLADLCIFDLCENMIVWTITEVAIIIAAVVFMVPVTLLFFVHIKNFAAGKTTNERFSRKARSSFSDNGGDTTTYLDRTESESLAGDGNASIVEDEEKPGRKSSNRKEPRLSLRKNRRTCMQNWKSMMCNRRVVTQRELYDRQVNKIEALSESYREAAQSSSVPSRSMAGGQRKLTNLSQAPSAGN